MGEKLSIFLCALGVFIYAATGAISFFFGANFADVSGPFCRNRFEIISEKWRDEGDDEKVIEYALSILAWKNDDTFSQYEEMVLLNCLGFALASLAEDKGLESQYCSARKL